MVSTTTLRSPLPDPPPRSQARWGGRSCCPPRPSLSSLGLAIWTICIAGLFLFAGVLSADEPFALKRCEIVPLPEQQVSFSVDGVEQTRWYFGNDASRPFFYPLKGPSGASLTRMGHPGAPNHDHHRSVWFAHHDVAGADFWSEGFGPRVRQKSWYAYDDGDNEAVMATLCGWYDGQGKELMEQDVVAALIPMGGGEHALEIQTTLRPARGADSVQLGKTNFGFLAVRVAKTLSVHFGGGSIHDSEGRQGEKEIFGQTARWMDYSGPVAVGTGANRRAVVEGITYFDHPANPRYPTRWHVREDGWMGASFCFDDGYTVTQQSPLTLRYLLHTHAGPYDQAKAQAIHDAFASRPAFTISKGTRPHCQYEVRRGE